MASSSIPSWQTEREKVEVVTDFLFLGSKITVDVDCSHEIRKQMILGRRVMTNLDSVLKSKDTSLLTKVCIVKATVFLVVMYGCDSWTTKKAECQRIDAFELQCWRRLLSPLDCKEIKLVNLKRNQPWILIGRTDVEAEAPILWLTWCELLTHWKRPWCWERLKAKEEGNRGWDGWMASPIQWTWTWENSRKWWRTGRPGVLQSVGFRLGHDLATVQQTNQVQLHALWILLSSVYLITSFSCFLFSVPFYLNVFLKTCKGLLEELYLKTTGYINYCGCSIKV